VRWVSVQEVDFNIQDEYNALAEANTDDGAIVFFVGRVRDLNEGDEVKALTLEHYPGMTEKSLHAIIDQACQRWTLNRVRVIHRVGTLLPADQIVFVAVSSPHRGDSFKGAEFIMDYLKTQAPFWKKENTSSGDRWVDAKQSDGEQAEQW
jgi:molybdopterin synthase catalytic subunit